MKKKSEFLNSILEINPNYDIELIGKAYDIAAEMHRNQLRKSGEPYLIHPLNVAEILADLGMDEETIVAGILHDVVEDTKYEIDDIEEFTWAVESIMHLHKEGVINGTGERTFSPQNPVTREEFIKMIVKALLKTNSVYDKEFGKKYEGKWYYSYMAAAEFYALIQGIYDEEDFKEEVYITRQDMCTIAYRAALRADIDLPFKTYSTDFYDMNKISFYATEAIKELQEADIIHGTGNNMFEPHLTTTRAEAAKIVHNLMNCK